MSRSCGGTGDAGAAFARLPQVLEPNRVRRLYRGGSGLDRWQGLLDRGDGYESEEFLVSTIPYIGPGNPRNHGISMAGCAEREVSLAEMARQDGTAFLGKSYAGRTDGHLGVLARVGDSCQRLILQCHPDGAFVQKHLKGRFGKTEAWYILDTRGGSGYCLAGLKDGVSRPAFERAFRAEDSEAMEGMLHKVWFKKGDMVLIPSRMPHAMGPGVTFLEFHEPCDYAFRFEADYFGHRISEEELHCGLGVGKLMECMDFTTYSQDEIERLVKKTVTRRLEKEGGVVEELLSYQDNPYFRVEKATVRTSMEYCQSEDSHCIMITAKGGVTLRWDGDEREVPQGRGIVLPARVGRVTVEGQGAEVLVGYPFMLGGEVSYGLFI